jgi:hypothetical protein
MTCKYSSKDHRPPVEILEADLNRTEHQQAVVELINAYAMDSMGNGKDTSINRRDFHKPSTKKQPAVLSFIQNRFKRLLLVSLLLAAVSPVAPTAIAGLSLHVDQGNRYDGLKLMRDMVVPWSLADETHGLNRGGLSGSDSGDLGEHARRNHVTFVQAAAQ